MRCDGHKRASAGRATAPAISASLFLTTSSVAPVWAFHSPPSRSAAAASPGSSTTASRKETPANGRWPGWFGFEPGAGASRQQSRQRGD